MVGQFSPSSSLRSPVNSADSEREASDVRLEEPEDAWLGGRLPISRLIQCSQREELVDPRVTRCVDLMQCCISLSSTNTQMIPASNHLPQSCWQTTMGWWHVAGKTGCSLWACRHRPQIWDGRRCHRSSTTGHRWSSCNELAE